MTPAQEKALRWLSDHNGDGLFDRNGVLLAGGESAPFMRATWNALRDLGLVEFYNPTPGRGRGRVRLARDRAAIDSAPALVTSRDSAAASPSVPQTITK